MNNNQILLEGLTHKINEISLITYSSLEELLDISTQEARIFLALILHDALSAREIAQVANIPRTKVYKHIRSLLAKDIIIERESRPANVYFASEPEDIQLKYISCWKEQLVDRERRLNTLVEELTSLQKEKLVTNPDNISVSNTFPEIFDAIEAARTRVWIVASGKGGMYNWAETARVLAELVDKGVDVTYIVDKPMIPEILVRHFEPLLKGDRNIRALYHKPVPHNLLIVDESLFIINIDPNRSSIEKIQHEDIIKTYILYLESIIREKGNR